MKENGRRDVVGHVAHQREALARENAEVGLEHIALDDIEPGIAGVPLAQPGGEHAIDLDRDHPARALEELIGEAPPAGTNLDDGFVACQVERIGDARENARVAEEVLPEALAHRRKGTGIALSWRIHPRPGTVAMRLPWQPKQPPLALRIARTLER